MLRTTPRNAEDDPYFSDGLRGVYFLPEAARASVDPVYLDWTPIGALARRTEDAR